MYERSLREWVAYILIFGHFCILALVSVLYLLDLLDGESTAAAFGVAGPIMAALTAAIVKYVTANMTSKKSGKVVTREFVVLSFSFCFALLFAFMGVVLAKASGLASINMGTFQITLAGVESAIGVYVTTIVAALFGGQEQ